MRNALVNRRLETGAYVSISEFDIRMVRASTFGPISCSKIPIRIHILISQLPQNSNECTANFSSRSSLSIV